MQQLADELTIQLLGARRQFDDQLALPDGMLGRQSDQFMADISRELREIAAEHGTLTWRHVLTEAFRDVCAESAPERLRAQLLTLASASLCWLNAIDVRQ